MSTEALPNDVNGLRAMVQRLTGERDAARAESRWAERRERSASASVAAVSAYAIWPPFRAARSRSDAAGAGRYRDGGGRTSGTNGQDGGTGPNGRSSTEEAAAYQPRRAAGVSSPHPHYSAPEHTVCPCCRGPLHVIGEDLAERLDVVPATAPHWLAGWVSVGAAELKPVYLRMKEILRPRSWPRRAMRRLCYSSQRPGGTRSI